MYLVKQLNTIQLSLRPANQWSFHLWWVFSDRALKCHRSTVERKNILKGSKIVSKLRAKRHFAALNLKPIFALTLSLCIALSSFSFFLSLCGSLSFFLSLCITLSCFLSLSLFVSLFPPSLSLFLSFLLSYCLFVSLFPSLSLSLFVELFLSASLFMYQYFHISLSLHHSFLHSLSLSYLSFFFLASPLSLVVLTLPISV